MPLQETLQQILTDYPLARTIALEGHPLAQFIRGDAEEAVSGALGEVGNGLVVQGSPGQGNWAAVPWIAVFDPAITTSATRGYYVVYLFHAEQPLVHLSLNQGTTAVREEFANQTRAVLADRAELMRKRVLSLLNPCRLQKSNWARTHACPVTMLRVMRSGRPTRLQHCLTRQLCAWIYRP